MGLARSRKITLVTVESCTAGALASAIAEAEGAGEVFHGGFVTYSKESKSSTHRRLRRYVDGEFEIFPTCTACLSGWTFSTSSWPRTALCSTTPPRKKRLRRPTHLRRIGCSAAGARGVPPYRRALDHCHLAEPNASAILPWNSTSFSTRGRLWCCAPTSIRLPAC